MVIAKQSKARIFLESVGKIRKIKNLNCSNGKKERGIAAYSPALLPEPGSNTGTLAAPSASRPLCSGNVVSRTNEIVDT